MVGILFAAVFLAFGHSLWQDFAPIDDTLLVRENLAVRGLSWANIVYVFTHYDPEIYIPVTFLSFQINYALGGLDPFGFHLGNLLLHAANAVLVFALLKRLIRSGYCAYIGAMIFAVHPLHTEAVVWIAGRKDLLSTLFYLLTLITYLRHRDGIRGMYLLSMLFAVLAMLSKAMAMTLPVVLILMDWYLPFDTRRCVMVSNLSCSEGVSNQTGGATQGDTWARFALINKIPFILLSILCACVAIGGKARVVGSTSMLDTGLVAIRSTAHYLWQMIVPMGFSVFYQQRDPILDVYFFVSLLSLIALTSLAWHFRRSKPWIAFGLSLYFITLSPTFLNFHKGLIAFYAVDRYAYLPSIGVIFIVLVALQSLATKMHQAHKSQIIFNFQFSIFNFVPVVLLAAILIAFSRHQTRVWDSPETLYRHAVEVDTASVPARATLAQVLRQLNRKTEAFVVLQEGLQFGDDVSYHLEAGNIYAANGQIADAIEEFTKASQMKPDLPEPLFSIGSLEDQRGNADLALEYYRKALALDTSYVAARSRIAGILIDRKEYPEAEKQLIEALRWNESSFIANYQMYRLRMAQGRAGEAQLYYERAEELRPGAEELQNLHSLQTTNTMK
jgi:Flp pilus assembly protein TadD